MNRKHLKSLVSTVLHWSLGQLVLSIKIPLRTITVIVSKRISLKSFYLISFKDRDPESIYKDVLYQIEKYVTQSKISKTVMRQKFKPIFLLIFVNFAV